MVMRAKVRGEELFKWGRERASPRTSNGLARRMKEGHSKLWRKRRGGKAVVCTETEGRPWCSVGKGRVALSVMGGVRQDSDHTGPRR